jgi:hypothetical protein
MAFITTRRTRAPRADEDRGVTMLAATSTHDSEMRSAVVTLLARAESLDHGARTSHPLVASAYRRRSAELKFAAWLGALKTGPVPVDAVLHGTVDAAA